MKLTMYDVYDKNIIEVFFISSFLLQVVILRNI